MNVIKNYQKEFSLRKLVLYFLKLGALGFGGSIALTRSMQKDLVEKEKWLTQEEFLRGLTLSQLAPGPLAAQLAMYIGYMQAKILGATIAGIAFILPSFLAVVIIGIIYTRFSNFLLLRSALLGIGAAVIGIITSSAYALTKRTMKKKLLLWIIYLTVFLITIITNSTNILFFLGAGILTMIIYTKEKLAIPKKDWVVAPFMISPLTLLGAIAQIPLVQLFVFFFMAGSIAFGGGLAILPFLQHGVISQYHWLTNKEFVDAVSIAMITPGPVVIAATFIGYLVANVPGAIIATIAIFLPVYLIVIFLTPLFNRHSQNQRFVAFIEGVTAAAMGSIAGSIILLSKQSIISIPTLVIAIGSLLAIRLFKIPTIILIVIAGIIGIFLPHA
ncbi:MAG TPA: chromate efflux transporter [Patescibacteria group bacterium]|nr:chromate efflux transporter [Patescibacteria group bacterium]